MRQQSYTGPVQWIVVDDGETPTTCTMSQEYIREQPIKAHSLCRNMRAAIPRINGDVVLIIEDDDYYHPHYVSTMVGRLQHADLVGEFGAKYYYIRHNKWRHRHDRENHASLCRTGITRAVIPTLAECSIGNHPSIDLRLWSDWKGSTLWWKDIDGTQSLCVGIKGVKGRQSCGWKPVRDAQRDQDREILRRWIGEDARHY
jgi:glycosyltransferase involved in cell wall biosynthesis